MVTWENTNAVWGQAGTRPWGEGAVLGQGCSLSMPLWCLQHESGAPGLSKVRSSCSNHFSWLDKSQTFWLVRRFKTAKLDLVAGWGHKSMFWVIFLAVKKYFKIDFPFPSHLFQSLDGNTNEAEHPSHATQPG